MPASQTQPIGTLTALDPEFVFANPFQPSSARRFRGEEFDRFCEDVRANGVKTPPPARPHPDVSGAVQLREGHRRLASWRKTHPGEPFWVIVQNFSDAEMLDDCIRENVFRADWNDIEIAEMMETYARVHPDATNAEIALKFNYQHPASVTNIRKLLKLPAPIQAHVADNKLPDAIARQLVGIANINSKAAQQIADKVAAAPKSEKQDVFESTTRNLYWNKLIALRGNWWSMDWLADAPVTVERDLGDGEHLIGACAGCVFNVNGNCARRPCFEEKYKLWAAGEVTRVAEQLKLAVAGENEKTVVLFKGEYNDDDNAKLLLNARKDIRALLRLAPRGDEPQRHNYLARVLGSAAVTLVTTDKPALDAYFAELRAKSESKAKLAKSEKPDDETDAERAKRIAAEKKEMDAKRAARSKMWKSYHDAKWLLESASRQIGAELAKTVQGAFVKFIEDEFCTGHDARGAAEEMSDVIEKEIKEAKDDADTTPLRLARVALHVLADETRDGGYSIANNAHEFDFERVQKTIVEYLSVKGKRTGIGYAEFVETFGVTLSDGWDIPPVHHSAFNCWHCGTFAGNMQEKLTQRDINEDGWIDLGKDGVFCSENHRAQYQAQHAANANADHKRKPKAKPSAKAKPAPKAAKRAKRK